MSVILVCDDCRHAVWLEANKMPNGWAGWVNYSHGEGYLYPDHRCNLCIEAMELASKAVLEARRPPVDWPGIDELVAKAETI